MDDSLCLGTLDPVCIHVAHHIMAHFLFTGLCHIIINIVRMGLQLLNLFVRNAQAQLLLSLSQGNPQASPGLKLHVRRKNILHLAAGIALGKRAYISVCVTHVISSILLHDCLFIMVFPNSLNSWFLSYHNKGVSSTAVYLS